MESLFNTKDDFRDFAMEVKFGHRYALGNDARIFLNSVAASVDQRSETITKGSRFWRAQIGSDWIQD